MSELAVPVSELGGRLSWLVDADDPTTHLALLERPEDVVPVLGAGISKPAGYPMGDDLASDLKALAHERGLPDGELEYGDPRGIASLLVDRHVVERGELLEHVAAIYKGDPTGTSETIDALLQVKSRRIVTLNYDRSIECRAAELGIDVESLVLSRDGERVLKLLTAGAPRQSLVVIHAHGIASDPSSIVLDGKGYAELVQAPYFQPIVTTLFVSRRLLFMGTQLDEVHFLAELLRIHAVGKQHLLVASKKTARALWTADRSPLIPEQYSLLHREYENLDGTHRELVALVEGLGRGVVSVAALRPEPLSADGENLPVVADVQVDEYVEAVLAEKQDPEDDDFRASYLVALGLRSPVRLEQLSTTGTRTLIEGQPGSGKSTLLAEVGSRLPDEIVPVQLRAPLLDFVGDPHLLLGKWLMVGKAFRENELADPSRLDSEVFHFLVDGLDEVPVVLQERAAAQIIEVARANAVHSFTVASRPVPALDAFGHPEWMRVAIAASNAWRSAYLESRGVGWSELVEASPLVADLHRLLDLPFFLKHTVELYKQGRLAAVGDMLALVALFVDAALERVDETLPADAVRRWLRGLALAMVIATKTELTLEEIAASLPPEFAEFGDAQAVAERLVSASLLRSEAEGTYGFVHRILGEGLAAEALLEIEPEASGVLDVAAPAVSTLIRGVRTDWAVPITLVSTKSERWRDALAARDRLAAARAVSSDAPVEVRREAAALIWNQYVEWRIWLTDRQRASIVDDEAVLVRLLETEGLGELQSEIRDALGARERETVGNAIRVLAALGDRSIEPQLRRILETADDTVLRRFAALAVRDLELDSLFFLVAHRAVVAVESVEAQDATYAAIDLAGGDDLMTFARHAARRGGEAMRVLGYAIRGRVAPRDELAVLRAWSLHRGEVIHSDRERLAALLSEVDLSDPAVAEDALTAACLWRVPDDRLRALVRAQPETAARAVVEAVAVGGIFPLEARWLLEEVDLELLSAAGASDEVLHDKARLIEWAERAATQ